MRAQDKNNLIISGVLVAILIIIACIWQGTRFMPLYVIAAIALLFELLYCMPNVCRKYYEWCDVYENIHWIPFVNVIQCFNPVIAACSVILSIIGIFCIFFLRLPSAVHKIFGENFMIDYADSMIYYGIVALLLVSILWGVGYCKLWRDIRYELASGGLSSKVTNVLFMITLFIPGFRVIGLLMLGIDLDAALNALSDGDDEEEFEEV